MEKHAYLIIAHNHFDVLERLMRLLDDKRNDIFVHIDKKVKNVDFQEISSWCEQSAVHFPRKRIDVRWGTQSQVKTELLLMRTAYEQGSYRYFHLISGVDLPIKTQYQIHRFFADKQSSYLSCSEELTQWNYHRLSRYHGLFPGNSRISKCINGWLFRIQDKLGVDRLKRSKLVLYKGGNWGDLTCEAVGILLKKEKDILRLTQFTVCADEIYKQTILLQEGCPLEKRALRLIVWGDGSHPQTLTMQHMPMMQQSDMLFARKFDPEVDAEVLQHVTEMVKEQEGC